MLFNQPLGANDPAVHHRMVGASNPGVLAPGAFPDLYSKNGLLSGVVENLSTPLPANAGKVYADSLLQPSPFVKGNIDLGNRLTQTGLTGSLKEAGAWVTLLNPGALADINSLGVGNSINKSNLRIFSGQPEISTGLGALTTVDIVSGSTVGINEPPALGSF